MAAQEQRRIDRLTKALASHLVDAGIDGRARIPSATAAARTVLARTDSDVEAAVSRLTRTHVAMAAGEGFVTGLGGFVTLPVAIPANVLGFYVLATHMVAELAAVRGHDVDQPDVRTAVLVCLTGEDVNDLLGKVGLSAPGGRITARVLRGLPPAALAAVNKAVAFRIVTSVGKSTLSRLGRGVPLAGGVIGGTVDAVLMRRIAARARLEFPQVETA